MNAITQSLLASAALVALATAPALAENPSPFHVTALHAGHVVMKTTIHNPPCRGCSYSSYIVYTSIPASDLGIKVKLPSTYYKWNSAPNGYWTLCSNPKQHVNLPTHKTTYARLGRATETYSYGCASGPTVFYGDTYKLFNKAGLGQTDDFDSLLIGKYKGPSGEMYKGSLKLGVTVNIGE